MEKIKLELTENELRQMDFNKEEIKRILISRAIYNESLDYNFELNDEKTISFFVNNSISDYFVETKIIDNIMINENEIINEYNENKKYFEDNEINFKNAHEIIKKELEKNQKSKLSENYVSELMNNMEDTLTLKKEDILYSKGNPAIIKQIIQDNIVLQKAKSENFFDEKKEEIKIINNEMRMNYYLRKINSIGVEVSQKEIEEFYEKNKEQMPSMNKEDAYEFIYNNMFESKINENTNNFVETIIGKYSIEEKVENELKKEVLN